MKAIRDAAPTPAVRLNPDVPAKLEDIIWKALEKDCSLRYQSAAEMRTDLQRLKRDSESRHTAIVTSAPLPTSRRARRKFWLAGAAVLVASGMTAGGLYYRASQPKGLTDKDTVLVAGFTNRTGDAVFDDTLKTALNVALNQSPFLSVLSDNKVAATLQMMTRPANTRLTPDVARELCQRAGSKAYITGSVASLGTQYVLGLEAVNCRTGDLLGQEQVTAPAKERVLDALGGAVARLRGQLGESLATVQKFDVPLESATTASLEALKAYTLGKKADREKGPADALPYHQSAIEIDPEFASAYVAIGNDYDALGQPERAAAYITKAFQLREHSSEREKLLIAGFYYADVTGELDKAVRNYQEMIESYPRSGFAYLNLGLAYAMQGQYEKAIEASRQRLRLDPDSIASYANLANYETAMQKFDEARQIFARAHAQKLETFTFRVTLYGLAFLAGNSKGMDEQQQWFASRPAYENYGLDLAADTEAYAGHLSKARDLTRRAVASAVRADNKEAAGIWLENAALREAAFGDIAAAKGSAAEGLNLAPASRGAAVEAALTLAMSGDKAASSLASKQSQRFPQDTQMQSLWLPAIRAQMALDGGNAAAALEELQAAAPIEIGLIPYICNVTCLYPAYIRGEAYLASGQGRSAAAEFQKILDHSGMVWNCWTGTLARLGVARANALQTRTSQGVDADAARVRALAAYKDFLALWKDADPDIPVLRQAKAELAKLQ